MQFGEHKTTREKLGDCGAIWISLEKSRETIMQFGEHSKIVEFNPQREDRKFEFGAEKHRTLDLIF